MGAVRLSLHWLGISKTLNPEQQEQAAETFGANGDYLSARKKLIDTRHPVYRSVTAIRSQMINLWKGMTLPYPEAGIRLIRQDDIEIFETQFLRLQSELEESVQKFDLHFYELKHSAQERLGRLYNDSDYPNSLIGLFRAEVDYPNVEPPTYLRNLDPELYAEEARRVSARFGGGPRMHGWFRIANRLAPPLCRLGLDPGSGFEHDRLYRRRHPIRIDGRAS
jgi:hypothetical protein